MKKSRLLPLFGLALFFAVLSRLDIGTLLGLMWRANPLFMCLSLLSAALLIVLKAVKWNVLIRTFGVSYPLSKSVQAWLVGFFIGTITPGRIGDLSRAVYLGGRLKPGTALTTVVVDRIIDITVLFAFAIGGTAVLMTTYSYADFFLTSVLFFAAFVCLAFLLTKKDAVKFVVRPVFNRIVPESHKTHFRLTFNDFYSGLNVMMKEKRRPLIASLSICVLSMFVLIFQYYFIVLSLNLDVSYQFLLLVIPVVSLLDTLPISFSGLGVRDISLVFFFSLLGLPAEAAVSTSVFIFFLAYVVVGLAGFAFWLKNPIRSKDIFK